MRPEMEEDIGDDENEQLAKAIALSMEQKVEASEREGVVGSKHEHQFTRLILAKLLHVYRDLNTKYIVEYTLDKVDKLND